MPTPEEIEKDSTDSLFLIRGLVGALSQLPAPLSFAIDRQDAPTTRVITEELVAIIDGLRSYCQAQSPLELSSSVLGEILKEVAASLSPMVQRNNIKVEITGIDPKINLEVDRAKLRLAFWALMRNAIDAFKETDGEREIKIFITPLDNGVEVRIKDNGPGIEAENLPYVFLPFMTSRGEKRPPRVGLGLTYAKIIIQRHGGSIQLKSKENEGTCVTVTLPIKQEK